VKSEIKFFLVALKGVQPVDKKERFLKKAKQKLWQNCSGEQFL
jgi:hypothetical protein